LFLRPSPEMDPWHFLSATRRRSSPDTCSIAHLQTTRRQQQLPILLRLMMKCCNLLQVTSNSASFRSTSMGFRPRTSNVSEDPAHPHHLQAHHGRLERGLQPRSPCAGSSTGGICDCAGCSTPYSRRAASTSQYNIPDPPRDPVPDYRLR
jgi:hypothetical protein